ncbi:MAG: hypothetical protein ACYC8T_34625 [Myxococcaceae bacterium]
MPDRDDEEVFATPKLSGTRFDRPELPVEVLPAFAIYRTLIVEVAKHLARERLDRSRAPSGFENSFKLLLREIKEGSAKPVLVRRKTGLGLNADGWVEQFAEAREVVSDAVQAANDNLPMPAGFPLHLVRDLEHFGDTLQDGDSVELITPTRRRRKPAVYTLQTRNRLRERTAKPLQAERVIVGAIIGAEVLRSTLWFRFPDGRVIRGHFNPVHEKKVTHALDGHRYLRVTLRAIVLIDAVETEMSVCDVLSVETWARSDESSVKSVEDRIQELSALEPGWLDGAGAKLPPTELEWVRGLLLGLMVEEGLPKPRLYPTEGGGIRAEWMAGDWSISLEIMLPERTAWLHALNLSTDETQEEDFELGAVDARPREALLAKLSGLLPLAPRREVE